MDGWMERAGAWDLKSSPLKLVKTELIMLKHGKVLVHHHITKHSCNWCSSVKDCRCEWKLQVLLRVLKLGRTIHYMHEIAYTGTFHCHKYSLFSRHVHVKLSDIPFLILRDCQDVRPAFAAITASTLLWRLSARFRSVFVGNFPTNLIPGFSVNKRILFLNLCDIM